MNTSELHKALSKIDGVENIEEYTLVNNYGCRFIKKGIKHDLCRWANMYGVDLGWGLDAGTAGSMFAEDVNFLFKKIKEF